MITMAPSVSKSLLETNSMFLLNLWSTNLAPDGSMESILTGMMKKRNSFDHQLNFR